MRIINPKPISEIRAEKDLLAQKDAIIAKLESDNAKLREEIEEQKSQLSRLNGDTNAFIDFYFSQFPEQA